MHQALIDAASQTALILQEPKPFVLQTSLDDFYVSYEINAYIKEPNKQAVIYSDLHQNIQDIATKEELKSCRRIIALREMEIGPRFLKVIWIKNIKHLQM
jgi:small-conductance mechanosensitive channel